MKRCPACNQTYSDDALSFCPNDGTSLVGTSPSSYNPQATIMAPPPSVTQPPPSFNDPAPSDWSTPSSYPPPPPSDWSSPGAWQQPPSAHGMPGMMQPIKQEQNLAMISLITGVLGLICFPILAPVAVVTGFMALSKVKEDPVRYGGKGLAIGGMVLGGIMTLLWVLIIFLEILSNMIH